MDEIVNFRRARSSIRSRRVAKFLRWLRWKSIPFVLVVVALAGMHWYEIWSVLETSPVTFISSMRTAPQREAEIICSRPHITDGDTFRCDGQNIRLANIDAPELPGHCRAGRDCTAGNPHAARDYLHRLTRGRVECQRLSTDVYGRTIARCAAGGQDLSCAMVGARHAVERYGRLRCQAERASER